MLLLPLLLLLPVPPLLLPSQPLLGKPISVFLTLSCVYICCLYARLLAAMFLRSRLCAPVASCFCWLSPLLFNQRIPYVCPDERSPTPFTASVYRPFSFCLVLLLLTLP